MNRSLTTPNLTRAVRDVIDERERLIKLGYTREIDDGSAKGQLVAFAFQLANPAHNPTRKQIVNAAATLIAEIERLDRAAEREG